MGGSRPLRPRGAGALNTDEETVVPALVNLTTWRIRETLWGEGLTNLGVESSRTPR